MSHFVTLVLVPEGTKDIEAAVAELLAPFDENKEVPTYERECYCVNGVASEHGRKIADEATGGMDKLRKTFADVRPLPAGTLAWDLDEDAQEARQVAWEQHIAPYLAIEKQAAEAHPLTGKPDPDCDECKGKGTHPSEHNPQSKWDWWMIGGRWTGMLSGYEPEKDPANIETCNLCGGTGKRDDSLGLEMRATDSTYTCNGCSGTGKHTKWPSRWKQHRGDVLPVTTLLKDGPLDKKQIPYALVTPDGRWHQKGDMGWFGMSSNEKNKDEWRDGVNALLEQNNSAVVCDLHT